MPEWTPEEARAHARAGGKARWQKHRQRLALSADERARGLFEDAAPDMAEVLIAAAKGEGDFAGHWETDPQDETRRVYIPGLDPKERAQFAKTVLEFGIGRPGTRKAKEVEETPEDDHGLELA